MSRRSTLTLAALVLGAGTLTLLPGGSPTASAAGLVTYGSCDELLANVRGQLRDQATASPLETFERSDDSGGAGAPVPAQAARSGAADSGATAAAVGAGATGTNLQEQDVDEPDSAKLRDGTLVVLANNRLSLVSATAQPQLLGSLALDAQGFASELLLVGERAVVVQSGWREMPVTPQPRLGAPDRMPAGSPTTRLLLVDLSTPSAPRLLEDATWDGNYLSARLSAGTVRLITSSTPQPAQPLWGGGSITPQRAQDLQRRAAEQVPLSQVVPQLQRRDGQGTVLASGPAVECDRVAHPAQDAGPSTLLVTTLRPERGLEPLDSTGVTADGDLVYASADRLYVGTSRWSGMRPLSLDRAEDGTTTELHAFDVTRGDRTRYVASGAVPGHVLGRWALSEHEGALRVATTRQPGAQESSSSLFVLAERGAELVETGSVHGLGKTEQIKSVRYLGDTAVVVTFRQTDPLYVLDLRDDTAPTVTGELKITGFSTYLHPLGGGLLLGLGLDATETGQVTGMQLSTFDLADPAAPRLIDRLPLGEGWSAALDDSRAFGYDPQRRLVTLPYQGVTPQGTSSSAALGLRVAADGTLSESGRLAVPGDSGVERVLTSGEALFAITQTGIVAGSTSDLSRTGSVVLAG